MLNPKNLEEGKFKNIHQNLKVRIWKYRGMRRCSKENGTWASRMPQQIRMLAAKPKDLSSVPGTHRVEGED